MAGMRDAARAMAASQSTGMAGGELDPAMAGPTEGVPEEPMGPAPMEKFEQGVSMVEESLEGGAHAIKFQTYKAHTLASRDSPPYSDRCK